MNFSYFLPLKKCNPLKNYHIKFLRRKITNKLISLCLSCQFCEDKHCYFIINAAPFLIESQVRKTNIWQASAYQRFNEMGCCHHHSFFHTHNNNRHAIKVALWGRPKILLDNLYKFLLMRVKSYWWDKFLGPTSPR